MIREDSFIDFVWRNVPGTFKGEGVLLLDVSVKMNRGENQGLVNFCGEASHD